MQEIFSELTHDEILQLRESHLHIRNTLSPEVLEKINTQVYYPHLFSRGFFYNSILDNIITGNETSMVKMVTPCLIADVKKSVKNKLRDYFIESKNRYIIEKFPELFV